MLSEEMGRFLRWHPLVIPFPCQEYEQTNEFCSRDCVDQWSHLQNASRDQIAYIHWTIEKAREFQKNIYFCFAVYVKAFDCVDHNKLLKMLEEMVTPDYLTCLLRNLYAGQEATVRTGHGTTDWFHIRKE